MRALSSAFTALSFACHRLRIVWRSTVKPPLRVFPQLCVKPRKLKLPGAPRSPRSSRLRRARRPNSISRVFSGCSSNPKRVNRSRSSARNRSASTRCSNPTTKSSAKRTTMTSPRACFCLHRWTHRSKHVVQVDIGQQRTNASALNRTDLTLYSLAILQHTGVEPFLDQPHDALIRHTMLDELHEPRVLQRVEEAAQIRIEHPVHLLRLDP